MKVSQLRQLIREEVSKTITDTEGRLLAAITPKPSGEFKTAVLALEEYLDRIGAQYDADELAYLVIDIKNAGAERRY